MVERIYITSGICLIPLESTTLLSALNKLQSRGFTEELESLITQRIMKLLYMTLFIAIGLGLPSESPSCICTMEWAPVCYQGKTFGNPCEAMCEGAEQSDVTEGECPVTPSADVDT